MSFILRPGSVPLSVLETVYRTGVPVRLDPAGDAAIAKAATRVAEIAAGEEPVYGVNTGFGKLASLRIGLADVVIRENHRQGDTRVQDPYCIRCQSQLSGACLDLLRSVARERTISPSSKEGLF